MRTISDVAESIIRKTPLLEEGLAEGLINLSALARYIKPEIKKQLYIEPSDAAVIMALSRLAPSIKKLSHKSTLKDLKNLSVRTGLVEYTFHPTTSLLGLHRRLFTESEADKELFMSLTQGVSEATLIVSVSRAGIVEESIPKEGIVEKIPDLAAITLKLSPKHIYISGVHYALLKALAWENINVIETISTYSEITLIFEEKDLSRAFACIQDAISGE